MIKRGGLYRRIGETAGYTTLFYGSETMQAGRVLIKTKEVQYSDRPSFGARPINILRQALKICGISYKPLLQLGNNKGVYLAVLSERNLKSLRTGLELDTSESLSVQEAVDYWKINISSKRISRVWTEPRIRPLISRQVA